MKKTELEIVKSLDMVDEVFLSIDKDKSVCASLRSSLSQIFLPTEEIGPQEKSQKQKFVKNITLR